MRFRFRGGQPCSGNFHCHLDKFHRSFGNLRSENKPSGQVEIGQHSAGSANRKGNDGVSNREGYKGIEQENGPTVQKKAESIGQKKTQPLKYQVLVVSSGGTKRPKAIQNPVESCRNKIRTNCRCDEAHLWSKNIDTCPVHEKTECSDNSKSKKLIDNLGARSRIEDTGASQGSVSVAGVGLL